MEGPIIDNYRYFLDRVLNEQAETAKDSVLLITSSTSKSNIKPELAKRMGIKNDVKYTVTANSLGSFLPFVTKSNSKFGTIVKVNSVGNVEAGKDFLSINGKVIDGVGSIVITKADLQAGLKIQAANNGLLVLARLGDALKALKDFGKVYTATAVNYAVKFSMGGDIDKASSRGYKAYFSKPGRLIGVKNGIGIFLLEAAMIAAGFGERVAKEDKIYGQYFNWANTLGANIASGYPKKVSSQIMSANHSLANMKPPALESWNKIVANKDKLFVKSGDTLKMTKIAVALLKEAAVEVARAVAPRTAPSGFGEEANDVFQSYSNIVVKELSTHNFPKWMGMIQKKGKWGTVDSKYGASGAANKAQKEGQFGSPQASVAKKPVSN